VATKKGAKQVNNRAIKIKYILAAMKAGYDVKLIVKFPETHHSIVIDRIIGAEPGKLTKLSDVVIRFFDPSVARIVQMPADEFKKLIAIDFPHSAMTLFRD
jgi:hypothetical protein